MTLLNPVALLRSPVAALIVLGLVLRAQVPHALDVYYKLAHVEADSVAVDAGYFAVGLELAVLMFVVRNREFASWLFAVVSTLINVAYYTVHGAQMWSLEHIDDNWPRWLVSVSLPAAIAFYSHVVVEPEHARQNDLAWLRSWWLRTLDFYRVRATSWRHTQVDAPTEMQQPEVAQPVEEVTQPGLDGMDANIINAVRGGATSAYAISKQLGCSLTTLKRRQPDGTYIGRLPALVASGHLQNGGSDYRLNEG